MIIRSLKLAVFSLFAVCLIGALSVSQSLAAEYQNAVEAWNVAVAHLNARNLAAARAPLEAALTMSPDEDLKFRIREALMVVYREAGESEKFIETAEYVVANAPSDARKSLIRRALLAHIQQQGKTNEFLKRHEKILKDDPDNITSLYLLSEAYATLKREPMKAAALIERLAKVQKKAGGPVNVSQSANLAQQYVRAREFEKGAMLYEEIAPQDEKLAAWHWKEAANAWLKANKNDKALAAAKKSAAAAPEKRSELLTHFWHRSLGDVFLKTGEPELAIPHYEGAIASTDIEGYLKDCQKSLEEARQAAKK